MLKGKGGCMTQEDHDAFIKEKGMTEEEHEKWHKEHNNDPEFWAKKLQPKNKKD